MSSWLFDYDEKKPWYERIAIQVLKQGRIPKHVAFIMDGNRRYASKSKLANVVEGHQLGFYNLARTLRWCRDIGISEVTVYAFSLENFRRNQDEVNGIMDLARKKFNELLTEREKIVEHQVRFRFFGNTKFLDKDIRDMIAEIEHFTKSFQTCRLNICMAYTSQDEITRAIKGICCDVKQGKINEQDITSSLVSEYLDSGDTQDPDLVIRTSGELRLSDFMLWQSSASCLYFDDVLWPEFSFWHLTKAILHYQRNYDAIQEYRDYRKERMLDSHTQKIITD